MTGTVAQVVAMISHGNQFLKTGDAPGFFPNNSSFQFCKRVDFRSAKEMRLFHGSEISQIADDPNKWFGFLRDDRCLRLSYRYRHSNSNERKGLEDFNLAGLVGGGGEWLIEANYDAGIVNWVSTWEVTDRDDPGRKIWSVTYYTNGKRLMRLPRQIGVAAYAESLAESLEQTIEFAKRNGMSGWIPTFQKALATFGSDEPEADSYHKDLLAGNVEMEMRRLFYAAGHAWVFGDMGWWNDVYFEDENTRKEFERVTSNLYDAVNDSYGAVLNN